MGTKIPDIVLPPPASAGTPCGTCWGVGKPFGDGATQDRMWIMVSGINKGPSWSIGMGEPVEGRFELLQHPTIPCQYESEIAGVKFVVVFISSQSQAAITRLPSTQMFTTIPHPACSLGYVNALTTNFVGGSIVVSFGDVI